MATTTTISTTAHTSTCGNVDNGCGNSGDDETNAHDSTPAEIKNNVRINNTEGARP